MYCNCQKGVAAKLYNSTSQTVNTNSAITLLNNEIYNNCSNALTVNNNTVTIHQCGTYFVSVDATVSSTDTGNISFQIFNNGTGVAAAIAATNASTTANNIGVSTLIRVDPSCRCVNNNAELTFLNTGVASTYTNIIVNIIKVI